MLNPNQWQRLNNCFLGLTFLGLLLASFFLHVHDFSWFLTIAIVSLLILADMMVFSYLKTRDFLSLRIMFLSFSFLFHLGYSWIYLFNPDFSFVGMDFSEMFAANLVFHSYIVSLGLIVGLYLGIQLGDMRKDKPSIARPSLFKQLTDKININRTWKEVSYRNTGLAVLFVSLPLRVSTDLARIRLGQAQDYHATFDFQLNGYLTMLSDMFIVGIVLLMIYYRNRRWTPAILLITSTAYLLYSMNSGSRGMAMITIVVLFFAYNLCVRKFKKGAIALLAIMGLLVGSYLTTIGLNRVDNTPDISGTSDTASRFLQEFGGTQLTMILVMRNAENDGDTASYAYGSTYVASLATVLPNTSSELDAYMKKNDFQKQLDYPTIGGSYLAELYYNFGQLSYAFIFIIGFILSRFEGFISRLKKYNKYILLALAILIARQSLWWIRDSSYVFPRYIVQGAVVMIIIVFVLRIMGLMRIDRDGRQSKGVSV